MTNFLSALKWPFRKLDEEASRQIGEKAAIGARAALGEAPILDALLKGEEVTLQVKIQMKGPQ